MLRIRMSREEHLDQELRFVFRSGFFFIIKSLSLFVTPPLKSTEMVTLI